MDSDPSFAKFMGETLQAEDVNKNTDMLVITNTGKVQLFRPFRMHKKLLNPKVIPKKFYG